MSKKSRKKKKKQQQVENTIAGWKAYGGAAAQMRRNKAMIESGVTYAGQKASDWKRR